MRLNKLAIDGFKNLNGFKIDFEGKDGLTVLIGNNASGKSNILEAISAIFAGLYNQKQKPPFDYNIAYKVRGNDIAIGFQDGKYNFKVNSKTTTDIVFSSKAEDYLPSQVIAAYSGEEMRLWENHYKPFYLDFIDSIRKQELQSMPHQKMFYVNKYYWNLALLTFLISDLPGIKEFCSKTLDIREINAIEFHFNTKEIRRYKSNPVVSFVRSLNPDNKETISITEIDKLKALVSGYEKDFFKNLIAAYMPKDSKLITDIRIKFNDDLTPESLSEGEKKLILIKLILEFLSDENSLILLDEPDSHIHISRKQYLKELFEEYKNRDNVITTHSPTLTHCIGLNHIAMLTKDEKNNVKVESKDKEEIVYELTKGIWSYQEQNIFLNSKKDILLVEGKYDKIYISEALKRLKPKHKKYQELDFEYLPMGGAEGLENFINKFTPKPGQKIIAILDCDSDGKKPIEKVIGKPIDLNFDFEKKKDVYLTVYPKLKKWKTANFVIEDYFKKSTIQKHAFKIIKKYDESFKQFPNKIREKIKEEMPYLSQNNTFSDLEFNGFKVLFDKLLEIKKT